MGIEEYLDTEIFSHPAYWILSAGAIIAIIIGFKSSDLWGNGGVPFFQQIIVIAIIPIAAYFIMLYHTRR
jgi:uncharacterized protein YacL